MNTTYELNRQEQETESNRLTTKCDHANLLYANEIEFRCGITSALKLNVDICK